LSSNYSPGRIENTKSGTHRTYTRSCGNTATPANEDRPYGEEISVLEAEGYDFELAGARLIARDAARVVSADTHKRLREILESDALMEELTNQIIVSSPRNDPEHVRRCEMLIRKLREGFLHSA
jgi:predicted nucleotidyltransferase